MEALTLAFITGIAIICGTLAAVIRNDIAEYRRTHRQSTGDADWDVE